MEAFPTNHDTGPKILLDGTVLPARDNAVADLNDALDNIFMHQNIAPFISQRLIQHLVTSNPSPAYVARVATVFNDNGAGVKGDLAAVVRAILNDPEARDATLLTAQAGKLKEPVLLMLNIVRGLNGQSDGVYLRSQASTLSQNLFYSPSVFNYYPPDYRLAGTTLLAPEFAIMNLVDGHQPVQFREHGRLHDAHCAGRLGARCDGHVAELRESPGARWRYARHGREAQ